MSQSQDELLHSNDEVGVVEANKVHRLVALRSVVDPLDNVVVLLLVVGINFLIALYDVLELGCTTFASAVCVQRAHYYLVDMSAPQQL